MHTSATRHIKEERMSSSGERFGEGIRGTDASVRGSDACVRGSGAGVRGSDAFEARTYRLFPSRHVECAVQIRGTLKCERDRAHQIGEPTQTSTTGRWWDGTTRDLVPVLDVLEILK